MLASSTIQMYKFGQKIKNHSTPSLSQNIPETRSTRRSKSVDWIRCDCCKCWFHAICGGYSAAEYSKIKLANCWIKCIVCCLRSVKVGEAENSSNFNFGNILQAVDKRNSAGKVSRKKSTGDKSTDSSFTLSKGINQVCSTPIVATGASEVLTTEVAVDLGIKDTASSQNLEIDNILVIDNIENPSSFSSSRSILKEINKYCPRIKVEFAYFLSKGGVAIHASTKDDRDQLLHLLPLESFGGGVKHRPKDRSSDTCAFIKGVSTSVSLLELRQVIEAKGVCLSDIRRICNRQTGRPTRVVRIRGSDIHTLVNTSLVINEEQCVIEKPRSVKVIRCYNCQGLGHIARLCKNSKRCENCAKLHTDEENCTSEVLCANCGGCHPASSSLCPIYISKYETLAKQHSEHKHIATVSSASLAKATDRHSCTSGSVASC